MQEPENGFIKCSTLIILRQDDVYRVVRANCPSKTVVEQDDFYGALYEIPTFYFGYSLLYLYLITPV